jgi:hypothetical protein
MKHIIRDAEFNYESHQGVSVVTCDVFNDNDKILVVFTEKTDNKGRSVTNDIERIVKTFVEDNGLDPHSVTCYERYEGRDYIDEVHFCCGLLASWTRATGKQAEEILAFLNGCHDSFQK